MSEPELITDDGCTLPQSEVLLLTYPEKPDPIGLTATLEALSR